MFFCECDLVELGNGGVFGVGECGVVSVSVSV